VRCCLGPLAIILLLTFPMCAQEYPGGEFFGGGSYASADVGGRENFFGWQISAAANPHRRMRLVGDFGGQNRRTNITFEGHRATLKNYQALWGPQFTWRGNRTTLFTNTVFGVAAAHFVTPSGDPAHPENVLAVDFGFAMALGGGVDLNVGRRFAIRVFQADYVLTHLHPDQPSLSPISGQLTNIGNWQHNFRLGFGLVVKVGKRGYGQAAVGTTQGST
jgi:hypothetical protein